MRFGIGAVVACALLTVSASWPAAAGTTSPDDDPVRSEHDVVVTNPGDGLEHTLQGFRVDPPCDADTAVVFVHGLSYTGEAWDVDGYSYTRILAEHGYATFAHSRLGYGPSTLDDGYAVSTTGMADMAGQVAASLTDEFDHVVFAGHSAGAETTLTATALFDAPVDAVVAMGYHTYPDPEFLAEDWITGDQVRAAQDDYEYFMGTPERRAEMFYTDDADQAVIDADTAAAVLTPSGEVQTISFQPSRSGSGLVDVPVLLQLAEDDRLFPSAFADQWAGQFVSSPSVIVDVVPGTGHTYMLHHEGPAAAVRIADWLADEVGLAGCEPSVSGSGTTADGTDAAGEGGDGGDGGGAGGLAATGGGGLTAAAVLLALAAVVRRDPHAQ